MWQPIETAPKDREILLYWPRYACSVGEEAYPSIAIGRWKSNSRLEVTYANGEAKYSPEETAEIMAKYASSYFSDNLGRSDDYALAMKEHAPTHWMPLPEPPA